jgi:hypothetical protein
MPVGATLAAATVASAVIGYSASNHAADTQAAAAQNSGQYQLDAARLAAQLQLGMFNTIRGDFSPYRGVGNAAVPAYLRLLGLGPAPSSSTQSGGSPVPANAGPYSPGFGGTPGGGGLTIPGINDFSGLTYGAGGPGGGIGALAGVPGSGPATGYGSGFVPPQVGSQNWGGYLQANPDIMAEAQRVTADGEFPSLEAYAQYHYTHFGQTEGRQVPTWTQEDITRSFPGLNAGSDPSAPGAGTPPATGTGTPPAGPNGPSLSGDPGTGTGDIESYLQSLPGYQFVQGQGIRAVTNSLSARGLGGNSGAMAKGIARFVTGLADQTYADQLSRIGGAVSTGQSAAGQTGSLGSTAAGGAASSLMGGASAYGNSLVGAANAAAAGQVGSANAITGGINGAANAFMVSRILGSGGGGINFAPSDIRLKTDVVKIGERADGLGIFSFRYLWSPAVWIGVMAQEVAKLKPFAVSRLPSGYLTVNYGGL